MAITNFTIPSIVKDTCLVYSNDLSIEGIRMNVYRWAGTDRVSIIWEKRNKKSYKAVGKMDMYFTDWYKDVAELIKDKEYLTNVMVEQGWGVLDLRDMNAVHEFDGDFF